MKKLIIFSITLTILFTLACGILPLPRVTPEPFDYHKLDLSYPALVPTATVTPGLMPEAGVKVREWKP